MVNASTVIPGIDVLTADVEIPGLGHLSINSYLVHREEPILVDTGSIAQSDEFDEALRSVIDVADLRWIWLTHTDFDHIGLLHAIWGLTRDDTEIRGTSLAAVELIGWLSHPTNEMVAGIPSIVVARQR